MPKILLRLIYHILTGFFSIHVVHWTFTCTTGSIRIEDLVQLTNITQILVTFYFCASTVRDFMEIAKKSKDIIKAPKTYLIFWTAFALSHLVTIGYWFLRLKDAGNVIPPEEMHLMNWKSNITHGGNLVMLYIEIILFGAQDYKNSSFMWVYYSIFTIAYIIMQIIYNQFTGKYVYPFLKSWPIYAVGIFYFVLYLILIAGYEIGQKIKGEKKIKQKSN